MLNVNKSRNQPNLDRISVLAATILLTYTLAGMISIPKQEIAAQLPGIYLEIEINIQTLVSILVAALAASGTDWLLREHASSQNQRISPHLLLPALTAWVIGVPLHQQAELLEYIRDILARQAGLVGNRLQDLQLGLGGGDGFDSGRCGLGRNAFLGNSSGGFFRNFLFCCH